MASSVTWIELIWTLIAVVSLGFTAWIIDDNMRNFAAIRAAIRQGRAVAWGPRWWVGLASLVSSAAMFIVWIGFAAIGVIAMTVSPHDPEDERAWISAVSGWLLIATTLILAGIQAWQVYARTKIRPLVHHEPNAIDEAADQTQHAADLVDALRTTEHGESEARP